MAAQQVTLREALKSQVTALIDLPDGTISESRTYPRRNAEDLESLHLIYFCADLETEITGRELDRNDFLIGLAIQKHLDVENVSTLDDLLELVEDVRSLWQPGGELRDAVLAQCRFKQLVQAELYDSQQLLRYGIFTAILELTYTQRKSNNAFTRTRNRPRCEALLSS